MCNCFWFSSSTTWIATFLYSIVVSPIAIWIFPHCKFDVLSYKERLVFIHTLESSVLDLVIHHSVPPLWVYFLRDLRLALSAQLVVVRREEWHSVVEAYALTLRNASSQLFYLLELLARPDTGASNDLVVVKALRRDPEALDEFEPIAWLALRKRVREIGYLLDGGFEVLWLDRFRELWCKEQCEQVD